MKSRISWRAAAIIFDLDGVLVDSMPTIRRYWLEWGRRQGIAEETVLQNVHLPAAELVGVLSSRTALVFSLMHAVGLDMKD